jgi:hypothetical protein
MKKPVYLVLFLIFALTGWSCSVFQTMVNVSRLKFKLDQVNNFHVDGIPVSAKTRLKDFSAVELLKLSSSFAKGKLPVSFIINVQAKNPNDGTGGYPRTNAVIKSFPWKLIINDKETVSGDISSPVSVPGTGEATVIPIQFNVDLMNFFKDKGYESLINLALNIGGYKGSAMNVALLAQPTVSTAIGNITYPGQLKIVSYKFTE